MNGVAAPASPRCRTAVALAGSLWRRPDTSACTASAAFEIGLRSDRCAGGAAVRRALAAPTALGPRLWRVLGPLLRGHLSNGQRSVVDLSLHVSQLVPAALHGALSCGLTVHLISIVSASPGAGLRSDHRVQPPPHRHARRSEPGRRRGQQNADSALISSRRGWDSNPPSQTGDDSFRDGQRTQAVGVACASGLQNRKGGAALRVEVRFLRRSVAERAGHTGDFSPAIRAHGAAGFRDSPAARDPLRVSSAGSACLSGHARLSSARARSFRGCFRSADSP